MGGPPCRITRTVRNSIQGMNSDHERKCLQTQFIYTFKSVLSVYDSVNVVEQRISKSIIVCSATHKEM